MRDSDRQEQSSIWVLQLKGFSWVVEIFFSLRVELKKST